MSSIIAVIETYEEGMEAKRQKNYLRAARLFRMCSYYYEEGELPVFFEKVKRYGEDAMSQFEKCNSMLTKKGQRMLKKEERNFKKKKWTEFVAFDAAKIQQEYNTPSPNKSQKSWWKRWLQ